ncbi:MAG: CheY-like receiver [Rhodospirillales bacterium]|nr:CheY-like receiver [Rhodospirillales bacterium]
MVALVIDDVPIMRDLAVAHLRRIGYEKIVTAMDGAHALNLLERMRPSFIVSDIDMPYVNGLQVLKNVRLGRTWAERRVPFLLLTGHSDADVVGVALQLDASAFLRKPIDAVMLQDRLRRVQAVPLKPRSVSEYNVISVDALGALGERRRSDNEREPASQGPVRFLSHYELVPGHVLAAAVNSMQAERILDAGTRITTWLITQLKDLLEIGMIHDRFSVAVEGHA